MLLRTARLASFVAVFALAACAPAANGPNDALTGTWTNSTCFGSSSMPADVQSCSLTLVFGADLTLSLTDTRQSLPATAVYPRCTTTRRVSGQRYSTSDGIGPMRVTIMGDSSSTVERTGCVNSADNQAAMADTVDVVPAGVLSYQLSANNLTISSGPLMGSFSRM